MANRSLGAREATPMQWFYVISGAQGGPVAWEEIVGMAARGTLKQTDLIWAEGQPDWQAAGGFPGLVFGRPPADENLKWLVPVGRSDMAIIAGYVGLFAVIGIGAPFAILFGILALRDIKRKPELGGRGRAIFAIVMGVVFTVLYGAMIISALMPRPTYP